MLSAQDDQQNRLAPSSVYNIDMRSLSPMIFPEKDVYDPFRNSRSTSSYVKTSEMCMGGGLVHFYPVHPVVKQEPVDFSISSLTSLTSMSSPAKHPSPVLSQDSLPVKTEPLSNLAFPGQHSSESGLVQDIASDCSSHPGSDVLRQQFENDDRVSPTEPTYTCTSQLRDAELSSKVPVMRICRQNPNSAYTASSNGNDQDIGPLKALPTSNNGVPSPGTSQINEVPSNGETPTGNDTSSKNPDNSHPPVPTQRKARLKFSPRIRASPNIQVPIMHHFSSKPNSEDSLNAGGNKENHQNMEDAESENGVCYQWDMSAFPKCVVQLKKLPLNMESMFLQQNGKEPMEEMRSTIGIIDGDKDGLLERSDSNKSSECNSENGGILTDGRKKKRSVEPREKARCSFCGMLTLSADVWRHLLAVYKVKDDLKNEVIENQPTLTCQVCGSGLCSEIALSVHMHHLHTGTKKEFEENFKCIICAETFLTQTLLAFHLQTHYCKQRNAMSHQQEFQTSPAFSPSPDSACARQYECLTCSRKFQCYQALNAHKKLHRQQPFVECDVCGKKFTKSYKLKCHLVVHTDEKPFKCTECCKSFRFKSSLRSHKFFHLGVNPYKCKYCNQGFMEGGNLLKHIRRTHQGHQSEICNICGKVFTDKQALKYHMSLHTNLHQRRRTNGRTPSYAPKSRESDATSDTPVGNETNACDDKTTTKEQTKDQSSYENSVLFHLLTSPQRDKQNEGNADTQHNVDMYEWSDSEHDSGMNSPPHTQKECLLCDMTFNTIQKMKKHLLSYHRISPRKLRRLMP